MADFIIVLPSEIIMGRAAGHYNYFALVQVPCTVL
jgi:hypothetical protein